MKITTKSAMMHDANSPASQIVKPLIFKDAFERIELTIKLAKAALREQIRTEMVLRFREARTQGVGRQDAWLVSLAETNEKLRCPVATSQEGVL